MFFRQCILTKDNQTTTSFIPEKFAKKGRVIKFRDSKHSLWNDGWTISKIGVRVADKQVEVLEGTHKKTREVSDI